MWIEWLRSVVVEIGPQAVAVGALERRLASQQSEVQVRPGLVVDLPGHERVTVQRTRVLAQVAGHRSISVGSAAGGLHQADLLQGREKPPEPGRADSGRGAQLVSGRGLGE